MVIDWEVIPKEPLGLADLFTAKTFNVYRTIKVIIISKVKDLLFVTFQVIVPSIEDFNNS